MAQLVRCYFREAGVPAADVSFSAAAGLDFEFALDVEFSGAEIAMGGTFRVMVAVKNFTTSVAIIPTQVAPAPVHNTAASIVAPRNQTFAYTVPIGSGVVGEFLVGKAALVVGAAGQDTDIGEASCVIVP